METLVSQHMTQQKAPYSLPLRDYAGKVSPGFIGNYIHNFNILGWHKKQRPSKHARRRAREKAGKRIGVGGGQEEGRRGQQLSESGYDTVVEQPATSPQSSSSSSSTTSSREARSSGNNQHAAPMPGHGTPTSPSSPSIDSALKRLLKDLHRCDVFIARSQTALQQVRKQDLKYSHNSVHPSLSLCSMQHCADGERELKQVSSLLHQHLSARENDLMQELHSIRETASKRRLYRKHVTKDPLNKGQPFYEGHQVVLLCVAQPLITSVELIHCIFMVD